MSGKIELATAYISLLPETSKLEAGIRASLDRAGKQADVAGSNIGKRVAASASKSLKGGWRPDQDIMAGIPNTKLDRIGARIGQVIGKGVGTGLKAKEAGSQFGHSFAEGAGSVGLGKVISRWHNDLAGGGAITAIGKMAGKSLSLGVTAAFGAGVGAIGLSLTKGFQRLEKIDSATVKLKQMNRVAERMGKPLIDVQQTVKDVTDSVTGTPYSLDAAFDIAVQAIGGGSKDVKRFMTDAADAAGFTGDSLEHMGLVLNQILAKGKSDGGDIMQLMEAGLPARSWIEDSYKLTSDQFDKMQAKGEITLDMIQKAIEDHAGGMAAAAGDTLQGAIDNMQTSFAKVGADFLSAMFGGPTGDPTEGMKDAVNRLRGMLDQLDGWIKAHRDDIRQFFESGKEAAGVVVDVLGKITSALKEHPALINAVVTAFAAWQGIKFLGLLGSLDGVLGKLALVAAAAHDIERVMGGGSDGAVNGGPDWTGMGLNTAAGAVIGGKIGGVPGALIGGGIGATVSPLIDYAQGGNPARSGVIGTGVSGIPSAPNSSNVPTVGGIPIPGLVMPNAPAQPRPRGMGGGTGLPAGVGAERWRSSVKSALNQYGPRLGISNYAAWEDALIRQIATESGGNPAADNPNDSNGRGGKQHVYGLLQFLPETFASHNISGGSYGDPNAQIAAALSYVKSRYGVDPASGAPLQIGRGVGYDTGGWLPDGQTLVDNQTGKPELVLNPDQQQHLADQGIDPNSLVHGTGGGAPPGPPPGQQPGQPGQQGGISGLGDLLRTQGFMPAAASSTSVAGTSSLSHWIDMGASITGGLIDTGTSLAQTAVSAAITAGAAAGTFGAAAPAAPAASAAAGYGINLLGDIGKRTADYWFGLAGIGADALMEQLSPFGAPRWMGYDYTKFVPQLGIQQALTSTLEKQGSAAIQNAFNPQNQPASPGSAAPAPVGLVQGAPAAQDGGPAAPANPATMPGASTAAPPVAPPPDAQQGPDLTSMLGLFDDGGWLMPGSIGVNMTGRPEPVLSPQQWDSIAASSSEPPPVAPLVGNLYTQDMQDAIRQLQKVQSRNAMQYSRVG